MLWSDRSTRLVGIALLLLTVLVIADAVLETVAIGDANPLARGDIEGMLRDINDHEAVFYLDGAVALIAESVVLLAVAAGLFVAFRERSRPLAVFGFAGLLAGGIAFVMADASSLVVGLLAADFVSEGGAGTIAPGDPATLEAARAVAAFSGLADMVGVTSLAAGLASFGAIMVWAPSAQVNPPRWVGGLALVAAAGMVAVWTLLANEVTGLALSGVGELASMLFLVALGSWMVMQPERHVEVGQAQPAAAHV